MKTYKNLNKMPIANWYECMNGRYQFMYEGEFEEVEELESNEQLKHEFVNLVFELKHMDTSSIRKMAQAVNLEAYAYQTGKEIYKVRAEKLKETIKQPEKVEYDLNKMCAIIESTLKIPIIDIYKISVNRFFEYQNLVTNRLEHAAN